MDLRRVVQLVSAVFVSVILIAESHAQLGDIFSGSDSDLHIMTLEYDEELVYATLISGVTGSNITVRQPGDDAFLYGIQFAEDNDQPCFLYFYWYRFNNGDRTEEWLRTKFDICWGSAGDDELLFLPQAIAEVPTVTDRFQFQAIHAINIATKDSGSNLGRVKGAMIFGSNINRFDDGVVEWEPALQREFNRKPNRTQWETTRSCDLGDVAVGVVIDHDSSTHIVNSKSVERGEIVGLSLLCATPQIWTTVSTAERPVLTEEILPYSSD